VTETSDDADTYHTVYMTLYLFKFLQVELGYGVNPVRKLNDVKELYEEPEKQRTRYRRVEQPI